MTKVSMLAVAANTMILVAVVAVLAIAFLSAVCIFSYYFGRRDCMWTCIICVPFRKLRICPSSAARSSGPSEGFPNGISHPCALWDGVLARWESCRRVVGAVGVIWKFRSTCRPGNYI